MSKTDITRAFAGGKAFIPFVTCGDPNIETTAAVVRALAEAGAAIIELGIPFSDPTAEGPVIQNANVRALAGGTTTDTVFDLVRDVRAGRPGTDGTFAAADATAPVTTPLVFMTYANVVFHYGIERFCQRMVEVGVDGLILPEVPLEEKDEFASVCAQHDLAFISLVAPTSAGRIQAIAREAEGFVYLVSSLGTTGMRDTFATDLDAIVAQIREVTDVPIAIGFGISTPDQARTMAAKADGVIVGSAIVAQAAEAASPAQAANTLGAYAKAMVEAVR
ncbi:tryptophan synthase subunit alpha [Eggerthellaceae bacterium zg-887]|uniref:tryptophan synthase subunit alpha n=1 Tax=Xiamenia xianingshaonis TaxID=2682776 RepID=UPI0014097E48|nr:tryptophan synthase subunit alpha [Xiamenia xianingshaonis]NHM15163.1 tryptophan synthase subunit alpha [Xiamenia xianingshaonis]